MAEKCGKCQANISQSKESFKCVECNVAFHQQCTGIVAGVKVSTRNTWKCDGCVSKVTGGKQSSAQAPVPTPPGDVNPVLEAIAAFRKDVTSQLGSVRADLKKVTSDIDQMKNQLEEVRKQHEQTKENVESLKKENNFLKNKINALESEMNEIQQHTRKDNLIITGIPVTKGENVYSILAKLSELIDLTFYRADVSIAHRLPGKAGSSQPPPIVVNFVSRYLKSQWIHARRKRRTLSTKEIGQNFEEELIVTHRQSNPSYVLSMMDGRFTHLSYGHHQHP